MIEEGKKLRDINKPFYRYWQAFYYSLFSSKLYVDVAKRWRGFGLGYLLLLLFVVSLPFSIRVIVEYNKFFNEELVQPLVKLPTLYLQNGKISVDKPMPYFIRNQKGQIVTIIDATGTIKAMDNRYPDLNILITKDKLFYRYPAPHFFFSTQQKTAANPVDVYPLSSASNAVFVGKEWVKTSGIFRLKIFFAVLIYPTIALVSFGLFLVLLLAFALMGQFVAKVFFKISISYKQSCRMLAVSMTPFMLVLWVLLVLGYLSKSYNLSLPVLIIIYFCYASLALKRESQKMVFL